MLTVVSDVREAFHRNYLSKTVHVGSSAVARNNARVPGFDVPW